MEVVEYESNYKKKKILNVAQEHAMNGGVGSVIDYLTEGINSSDEFEADTMLINYDLKNMWHKESKLKTKDGKEKKLYTHEDLEDKIKEYDIVHIHGLPHYGLIEVLERVKNQDDGYLKIVNTAHSNVKQDFRSIYDAAKKDPGLKEEHQNLKYLLENGLLYNPRLFPENYWGSQILWQERIMSMADLVQHMSETYKNDTISDYLAECNDYKHVVIPNGVKVESENQIKERPKKKRITYVGRFSNEKGINELIEAIPRIIQEHPDAEINLVGGDKKGKTVERYKGRLRENIKNYFKVSSNKDIDNYMNKINFTGWVEPKDIKKHYEWTDYVIIPSNAESFSLVASDALANKRIPIITKTDSMDELYISKGIAFGIEPDKRHGEGIAQTVNEILDNHDSKEHDEMAEKGRQFVIENYSFEKMIENQMNAYRELLGGKNKKRKNATK